MKNLKQLNPKISKVKIDVNDRIAKGFSKDFKTTQKSFLVKIIPFFFDFTNFDTLI